MNKNYLKFLKNACFLAFFAGLTSLQAMAQQRVRRVTNAEVDGLKTFIQNTAAWAPGDTVLLTSAGNYTVNGFVNIAQNLTVMGDPTLASRPMVTFHGGGFMPIADNLNLIFKGFDLNGLTKNEAGAEQRAMILTYGRDNAFGANVLRFEDLRASGFDTGVELYYNQGKTYESVVIDNVIWNDFSNWVFNPRINALKSARITNSTFYNVGGFMFNPYFTNATRTDLIPQSIIVDHNTFYNVANNNKALFQINDPRDASVTLTFSNNIVSTLLDPGNSRPFLFHEQAGTFNFNNNAVHNFLATAANKLIYNLEEADKLPNVNVTNTITTAPGFADPSAGDFRLPTGSPLLTAGTNGGAIGDPTWVPNGRGFAIHRIANTTPDALKTFIENTAGWAPGDIIMLDNAGEYVVTGQIGIMQDVTIMGNPDLATRPLIKVSGVGNGGLFVPKADNLSMTFKGFNVDGKSLNASNSEQKAIILQYGSGAANAFGAKLIKFEDMKASGLTHGFELYPSGGRIYDKIVVNNVEWSDITQWIFWPRINAIKDVDITNSTFYNAGGFINNPYFSNPGNAARLQVIPQNILVDHNTFHEVVNGNRALIQMNDGDDRSVSLTFTNNLVSTIKDPANARPFLLLATKPSGSFDIHHNVFYNFETTTPASTIYNLTAVADFPFVTVASNTTDNPNFADAAAANFTLPVGSLLLTAGTNNSVIGDPQWVPKVVTALDPEKLVAMKMYPNPAYGTLFISAPSVAEVTIRNLTGSVVYAGTVDQKGAIDIANLKAGIYITTIKSGSTVQSLKLFKQ